MLVIFLTNVHVTMTRPNLAATKTTTKRRSKETKRFPAKLPQYSSAPRAQRSVALHIAHATCRIISARGKISFVEIPPCKLLVGTSPWLTYIEDCQCCQEAYHVGLSALEGCSLAMMMTAVHISGNRRVEIGILPGRLIGI